MGDIIVPSARVVTIEIDKRWLPRCPEPLSLPHVRAIIYNTVTCQPGLAAAIYDDRLVNDCLQVGDHAVARNLKYFRHLCATSVPS